MRHGCQLAVCAFVLKHGFAHPVTHSIFTELIGVCSPTHGRVRDSSGSRLHGGPGRSRTSGSRDLEQMQQAILCQGTSYEVVAAASPDASLLVPFTAATAPGTADTSQDVEPYVPPVLPGSSYTDMPYIPSAVAQQPSPTAFDTEPGLQISAPADPTLYEPWIEREEEEAKKKKEEAEPNNTMLESKKKEELLVKKKE